MPRCTFCKREYDWPQGTTVVKSEGEGLVRHFCSHKCRMNFEMGRDNKKVNWVRKKIVGEESSKEAELHEIAEEEEEK